METEITKIVLRSANLSVPDEELHRNSDLFALGMSSLATVDVMLAIENAFDVEFSNEHLCRKTFRSIDSLMSVVTELKQEQTSP